MRSLEQSQQKSAQIETVQRFDDAREKASGGPEQHHERVEPADRHGVGSDAEHQPPRSKAQAEVQVGFAILGGSDTERLLEFVGVLRQGDAVGVEQDRGGAEDAADEPAPALGAGRPGSGVAVGMRISPEELR